MWCYLLSFFEFVGVREWSKNVPGTRTIIFPVSIAHIVHSRSISTQFVPFRPSPILCISARQRLFFLCNKKFGPNPSYLRSGEFVLSWDTKNRSSHTQIIHIEILRAQMYLKSDETEGNLLSEHMNIFARNRLLAPKGVILYSTNIIINFHGPGVGPLEASSQCGAPSAAAPAGLNVGDPGN